MRGCQARAGSSRGRAQVVRREKRLDLGARRRAQNAAIARAFERGGRGRKAHRRPLRHALGQHQREGAVERVAGAERVDHVDLEGGNLPQLAIVEPQHVVRAVGDGEERLRLLADVDQRAAEMVGAGGRAQALGREHHMESRRSNSVIAVVARLVGVEHDRDAARARRRADVAHISRESDCRRSPHRRRRRAPPGSRGARRRGARRGSSRSPARRARRCRSPRSARARPATRGQAEQSMCSLRGELQERVAGRVGAGRPAERAGKARARAEMRDRDRGIRRVAAIDGAEFARLRLHLRARKRRDAEQHVEHRDAGAQHMLACISRRHRRPLRPRRG